MHTNFKTKQNFNRQISLVKALKKIGPLIWHVFHFNYLVMPPFDYHFELAATSHIWKLLHNCNNVNLSNKTRFRDTKEMQQSQNPFKFADIWASAWQTLQNGLRAQHPLSLIRVFADRMKKAWVLSCPLRAQQRLWLDWVDAQANLCLRWAHMPFCRFCHALAHLRTTPNNRNIKELKTPWKKSQQTHNVVTTSLQRHDVAAMLMRRCFVCVEVLRPRQPNGVISSAVSLPNHTFTGQA